MIYTMHKHNNILADIFVLFTTVSVVNENQRKKKTRIK